MALSQTRFMLPAELQSHGLQPEGRIMIEIQSPVSHDLQQSGRKILTETIMKLQQKDPQAGLLFTN